MHAAGSHLIIKLCEYGFTQDQLLDSRLISCTVGFKQAVSNKSFRADIECVNTQSILHEAANKAFFHSQVSSGRVALETHR